MLNCPGIAIAQMQLIFKLPDEFGPFSCPLAYVHWFKPLRAPEEILGMHTVSFSSCNHRPNASIIPVTDILCSCHFIPKFGNSSTSNLGWTASLVHQESSTFYLNPYLRHCDFYLMRFRFDRFDILRKKQEQ